MKDQINQAKEWEKMLNTFEKACYRFALYHGEGHKKRVAELEKQLSTKLKEAYTAGKEDCCCGNIIPCKL